MIQILVENNSINGHSNQEAVLDFARNLSRMAITKVWIFDTNVLYCQCFMSAPDVVWPAPSNIVTSLHCVKEQLSNSDLTILITDGQYPFENQSIRFRNVLEVSPGSIATVSKSFITGLSLIYNFDYSFRSENETTKT